MTTIRLDKNTEARLERLCLKTGHTKNHYVNKMLNQFLDDREDYLLGIAVLERNEETLSLKELEKELGLDD